MLLSLSKELSPSAQGQAEKVESSPLCLLVLLLAVGGTEAHESDFCNQTSYRCLEPAPLSSLASCLGQMHCVYLCHRHIYLPRLTNVSVGTLWCCQLRGFPLSLNLCQDYTAELCDLREAFYLKSNNMAHQSTIDRAPQLLCYWRCYGQSLGPGSPN